MGYSWWKQLKSRRFLVGLVLSTFLYGFALGTAKILDVIIPLNGVEMLVWFAVYLVTMYYVFMRFDKWYDRYFGETKLDILLDKSDPDLERSRYKYRGVMLQWLNTDLKWYVICKDRIVNQDYDRRYLEKWIDSCLDKK